MSSHVPKIHDDVTDWITALHELQPDLAEQLTEWIIGPLHRGEVDAIVTDGPHGDEYASRFPGTNIQVFWRVSHRGRVQVFDVQRI